MNAEFFTLPSLPAGSSGSEQLVRCAIRIRAPIDVNRTSTHFVLLLDISESMVDGNKLEYVKKCCHLVVDLLNEQDNLSLITFGDNASICLSRVPVTTSNKEHIRSVISGLSVNGCTNMSAGLFEVRSVLEGSTQKTGLLVLTDGLINRGITLPISIANITDTLRTDFPNLSVHTVGYGTDHNADLLRLLAVQSQASYNIVNSLEDTAVAFGDVLGGLMSCAYQNVSVLMPADAKLYGPYKNTGGMVSLGDVYAGTHPTLLFEMKKSDFDATQFRVKWTSCSEFKTSVQDAVWAPLQERDKDIDLCFLRYECSDIMRELSDSVPATLSGVGYDAMKSRIQKLEDALADSFLAGCPLTTLLLSEIPVLRTMFSNIIHNRQTQRDNTILTQHSACLGLGRGFSSPMGCRTGRNMDPVNYTNNPSGVSSASPSGVTGEPILFQNTVQRSITGGLRSATQTM